jgi:hypothetical protein
MAFGDFTVTRASTKNVLGSAGTYVSVANNVPALEFNTDGSYRGLLVEPGATNLLMRSTNFNSANFTKTGCTTSQTTDPLVGDCTLVTESTTTEEHSVSRASDIFALNSVNRSIELAIKNVSGARYVYLTTVASSSFGGTTGGRISFAFDLELGTVVFNNTNTTIFDIQQLSGGWWRISGYATVSADGSGGRRWRFGFLNANNQTESYTGTGKQVLITFGGAYVDKPYLQSPIVTEGSTVSRAADVISLTSSSSLIGQTANTLYIEGEIQTFTGASDACIFALTDGTSDEAVVVRTIAANSRIGAVVRDGGSNQAEITSGSFTDGSFKCAIASAVDDVAFYLNGSSVGTDASATHPAMSVFQFGGTVATVAPAGRPVHFRAIANFPTRLENTTLATLTTL